jgi:two-component system, OmpR family, sensor histidine kinase VicK
MIANINKTNARRIELLHDTETIINTYLHILHNANSRWDYFADTRSLSVIPSAFEEIKKAMLEAKARDTRLRFITEITKENISYTKEFMESVELRHLDGVRGNFGVSDTEYIAISTIDTATEPAIEPISARTTTIPHAVYSNVKEDVQQQLYVFEILWNKATPAEQRIREIDEGVQPVSTRILEDQDQIVHEIRRLNYSSNRLSVCSRSGGMQMSYKYFFDSYKNILDKQRKGEGKGMRWIINIDKENLNLVKVFLKAGIQIRHVKNMPPMNFGVSDKEMAGTIEKMEGGKMSQSFLFSNEPLYIEHFNSLFEELWENGIDAIVRIKAIEEGVDSEGIKIIQDPLETQKLVFSLIQKANEEILVMYSTANAFHRQERAGKIQLFKEAATERGVKFRILTPKDELIVETARKLMIAQKSQKPNKNISIRYIQPHLQTKVTILIVDRKYSLAIELKDDTKQKSIEAIGLATYSNSQSTVLSYVSIFESLWTQTELYQKLKESEEVKDDFVHIAAHELRTPIQPILGLADILRSKKTDGIEAEYLDAIIRNAKRLQRLTEDILDISRIESKSLDLKKESFNLNDMILTAIMDSKGQVAKERKDSSLKLEFDSNEDVFIEADKSRINQVISNLISNAIKFTDEGTVSVSVAVVPNTNEIVVSITDSGPGIDSEILPRLFMKFVTKSSTGTGLGLFISKSIIEAHGGKIWGKNNYPEGKGATFGFSLPLQNRNFVV